MNHDYIEQFDLVDRYLMGRLVAEESEQFEEHFIACPQCIDQLKTTREFKQGLQLLALDQASERESYISKESRWLFRTPKTWAAVACLLLLAATASSIVLFRQAGRLRLEADQAETASREWQRRYEEQQQSARASEQQRQEIERDLTGQVQKLKQDMQRAEQQRAGAGGESRGWSQPGINLPIFVLNSVRGNNSSDANTLNLSRSPMNFVITVPVEGEAGFKTYRVRILARDRLFWQSTGLKPDRFNVLTIGFNSSFFPAGNYVLITEGVTGAGESIPVGNYSFRVTKNH